MKTVDAAQGKWREILSRLGMDDRHLRNKHTDCPLCGEGKDRYRFDDKDGRGTWICGTCGAGDGMRLAVEWTGRPFRDVAAMIDEMVGNIEPEEPPKRSANRGRRIAKILEESVCPSGNDAVTKYLRGRRLPRSPVLRMHPDLVYYDNRTIAGRYPAMLSPILSPSGEMITLHVTYLTPEGGKAPVDAVKKILPHDGDLAGAAIRLTRIYPHMGIAEGIETALAVMKLYRIPCWAAVNAGLLEKFAPPAGIERVTVFGDNDASFTGQRAAYVLAHRLANGKGKIPVEVRFPPEFGMDFADLLAHKEAA